MDYLGNYLKPLTSILRRDRRGEDTGKRDGHVKMEAEIRVMQPCAKESLEPPEDGRGRERSSPRAFRGSAACQHVAFGLLASRTVRE